MKNFDLVKHSIIMMIGPSNSGKSYFCKNILNTFFEKSNYSYKYLSSDDFRRKLLFEEDKHKHEKEMMYVSKQAFSLLESELNNFTQYPINTDFVVVDATHLSKMGRKNVIDIAKKK